MVVEEEERRAERERDIRCFLCIGDGRGSGSPNPAPRFDPCATLDGHRDRDRDQPPPAPTEPLPAPAHPHARTPAQKHPLPNPTMDAPEDRDVKLQKVSGDLLTQFRQRLPELLQAADGDGGRKTVDSLIQLVSPPPFPHYIGIEELYIYISVYLYNILYCTVL